jgi:hypothetical protein
MGRRWQAVITAGFPAVAVVRIGGEKLAFGRRKSNRTEQLARPIMDMWSCTRLLYRLLFPRLDYRRGIAAANLHDKNPLVPTSPL